jgi:alkaline phosphatase D
MPTSLARSMAMPITSGRHPRRRFFEDTARSTSSLFALAILPPEAARSAPSLGAHPFTLGVASGDPEPHGVVLWTRLAPNPLSGGGMPNERVRVDWVLAEDEGLQRVVRRGTAVASPELAHSIHVEVEGLQPQREYFYQFKVRQEESPVGRTRTAPERNENVDRLRFAFASCQKWDDGFYSAYRRLAEEDLDLVLHLGDYIYEYGIGPTGGVRHQAVPEAFRPETQSLERHCLQHALYKTDPDLQRAHARFPWIVTWDDHEVENDYTGLISENNDPVDVFRQRRANAYQAYYEHLPLRRPAEPRGRNDEVRLYRDFTYGNLLQLEVLDTRQYRSDHPCGDGEKPRCAGPADPAQTMTGQEQERWLFRQLDQSSARWNCIAQQVLMAELLHRTGPQGPEFWQDSWDDHPLARQGLLEHIVGKKVSNPVVITGDWHPTFVNDLKVDFRDPRSPVIRAEFVGTSISSNGDIPAYGPYYAPMIPLNPHIKFFDGDRRGYVRCQLDRQRWLADLRIVATVSRSDAPICTLASFVVEHGKPGVQKA